jgi:hypothetical protein
VSDVTFAVLAVAPEPYAVTPLLTARIGIAAVGDEPVHAIALRCQVRIEPLRRGYTDDEAAGLLDLFGTRDRWSSTQHSFLWQHTTAMVPGFSGTTQIELPLVCTYDLEVTAAKYLHALRDDVIPLQFLFSGTVFTKGHRNFAVHQIPWDREDHYDMPVWTPPSPRCWKPPCRTPDEHRGRSGQSRRRCSALRGLPALPVPGDLG